MTKRDVHQSYRAHDSRLKPVTVAVLAALAAVPAVASANQFGDSLGSAFRVDTNTTTNGPGNWRVASDAEGEFVVTWSDDRSGTDTIYARLYAADGTPATSEFVVSTSTATSSQRDPAVAMDAAGDFVVAWDSQNGGSEYQIYARRYAKDGTALDASDVQVSTITSPNQRYPAVAMDAVGDFVVTWNNESATTTVQARTYTSDATASSEFQVNTGTLNADNPTVAMDVAGDFVISYSNKYASQGHVYASVFKTGTTSATTTVQVDTLTATSSTVFTSTVAMDAQGDFVVAWEQVQYAGPSVPVLQALAQRFNPDGTTNGSQVTVPIDPLPYFGIPTTISMDAEGDFIVGWMEYYKYGSGHAPISKIQLYNKDGSAAAPTMTLGSSATDANLFPSVAMDAAGDTVASWVEYSPTPGTAIPLMVQRLAGQGVDLATTITAPSSVTTGGEVMLTLSVANASTPFSTGVAAYDNVAGSAVGTSLDLVIPSGTTYKSSSGTNWTCTAPVNGVLSCSYSTSIAPGASAEPLSVALTAPTSASAVAFLSAADAQQADPDLSNNYAAAAVNITAASSSGSTTSSSSGGGAFGWLTLGIFGLLGWRRRRSSI